MRILDRSPTSVLSLRTVAREAGVAGPSLYRQFADADEMMKVIVHECWDQLGSEMATAARPAGIDPHLVRLQDQMGAYVHYAMRRPSRYQLLFAVQVDWGVELDGPVRPAYRVVLETIEQHVAQNGKLPTMDAVSAAIMSISFAHGRVALAHLAPARTGNQPADVEFFVRDTIRRLFSGHPD